MMKKRMLNYCEILDCILVFLCYYSVYQTWLYLHGSLDGRSFYLGPVSWLILYPIRTLFYAFKKSPALRERKLYSIDLIFQIMAFLLFFCIFHSPFVVYP